MTENEDCPTRSKLMNIAKMLKNAKGDNIHTVYLHGLYQHKTKGSKQRLDKSRSSLVAEILWREFPAHIE